MEGSEQALPRERESESPNHRFTTFVQPDTEQGGYWVTVPALPGCFSQGETLQEAITHAQEAIALHLEGLKALGEPIPEEREHPQAIVVDVAA